MALYFQKTLQATVGRMVEEEVEVESLAMKLLPCSTNQAAVNRKDEKCRRRNQARIIEDSWEGNLMLSFLQKEKKNLTQVFIKAKRQGAHLIPEITESHRSESESILDLR